MGFLDRLTAFARQPTLRRPASQLCTHAQFLEPDYLRIMTLLGQGPIRLHRKDWEWVYIQRVLECANALGPGKRGLGFGCGREPLVSSFAATGASVVATDAPPDANDQGWAATNQFAANLDQVWDGKIVARGTFDRLVQFRPVDMNSIPADLTGFDFVWSSCSLEHLGGLRHGMDFVRKAMACLKPGGTAVHTTEFNVHSNDETVDAETLCLYRRKDIEQLARELRDAGHKVARINFNAGSGEIDDYVDAPPWKLPHLKLSLAGFTSTSIGLSITRGMASH